MDEYLSYLRERTEYGNVVIPAFNIILPLVKSIPVGKLQPREPMRVHVGKDCIFNYGAIEMRWDATL